MKRLDETHKIQSRHFLPFLLFLIIGFLFLSIKLFELQIIEGPYFRALADENRVRKIKIVAERGKILARGGEELATNIKVSKKIEIIDGRLVKVESPDTKDGDLTEYNRLYPAGDAISLVGYLGLPNNEKIQKPDIRCPEKGQLDPNSLVGITGLEYQYDCLLAGVDGEELVEVTNTGQKVRVLGRNDALKGGDLKTTIDYNLALFAFSQIKDITAAVVITDPWGQVLSLVSSPTFDPNVYVSSYTDLKGKITEYQENNKFPLLNRAISGSYHPGSIFKMLVGSAAFQEGKLTSDFTYNDTGVVSVNGFDYTTWYFTKYGRVEGNINFNKALSRSTDTFFYILGQNVGIDSLVYWANKFGIGEKTNIDLPGEVEGLLPTPSWKKKTLGENWYLGNTFHFSIGQGDLLLTPIQANQMTSVFANGGYLCRPYLFYNNGQTKDCREIGLSKKTLDEVISAMVSACKEGGTGYPFFDFKYNVACKTGTAETGENSQTHAWFQVIAPIEKPEIVVTVLVEKGGEGSSVAAPIARKILDYYFEGNKDRL